MITDCLDSREVSDFHFFQLKTLKLTKGNETVPTKSLNIVASASKYGLLFVGIEKGFKVLRLEDVLDLDHSKENRGIEENYPSTLIQTETPLSLSLNASQTVLAVCAQYPSCVVLNLYDVSAFVNLGSTWQPFCNTPLSSQGVELRDFIWNPVADGLFAYCLSDGSLHIQELSGTSVKPSVSAQNVNALSMCWSPKGKQLVVGKNSGHFTQYKPNLQEVKTINPPPLELSPVVVSSICWISNTTFAVLYVADDSPNLFIVSTTKDAPVRYENFYDVCLGNNSSPSQKYFMHLEPAWGILICASIDSIEVAVLGDMPNWVQWDLKEDGKALLPGKDGATHAIGLAVIYSAQKRIIISESEAYPPMPVMFVLTNNGLLLPFHMINSKTDAVSLVSPPLLLESKKRPDNERTSLKRSSTSDSQLTQSPATTAVSTFAASNHLVVQANVSQPTGMNPTFGVATNSSFSAAEKKEPPSLFASKTAMKNVNTPEIITAATTSFERNKQGFSSVNKENDLIANRNSSFMAAIISEIQSFSKELQDLKELHSHTPSIDSEADVTTLKTFSLNLQNFQKDITETMQSLNNEIFVLKNILLENFVMVEEANSRDRRRNDHSYITMLKERALDPVTAKCLQKMNQRYQYLNIQLQEVSDKLDQDSIHLFSHKKNALKAMSDISSTEAIYKTIVSNQKIIHNLKKELDTLLRKTEEKKLRNISKSGKWSNYHKRSTQEDLSKLADEFLQVKVSNKEEKEPPVAKKLSSESQKFLISFLKESNVVTVRPTAVYSPSQSRLLSNAATFEDTSIVESSEQKSMDAKVTMKEDNSKIDPRTLTFASNIEFTPQPYTPVYEAITPPEISTTVEHTTFTYAPENESRFKHIYQPVATQPSISNASSQEISLTIPTPKNSQDVTSKSASNDENPVSVRTTSSQLTFSSLSSSTVSKTTDNVSSSDLPKSVENGVSKPTPGIGFAHSSSTVSSFQFGGPLAQKGESGSASFSLNSKWVNVQPVATSAVSPITITEVKGQIPSGTLLFGQQDKSNASKPTTLFSAPSTQNSTFTVPTIKSVTTVSVPQTVASFLPSKIIPNVSETKSSFEFKLPSTTQHTQKEEGDTQENKIPSNSPVSLFSSNSPLPATMNSSETSKTVVTLKSPEPISQIPATSGEQRPNIILIKSDTGNIPSGPLTITPIKSSEGIATSSSKSSAVDTLSSLSILKEAITSSETDAPAQNSSVVSPIQTTIAVSSPAASSVSSTSSLTAPVISSTVSIALQPSSLISVTSSSSSTSFALTTSSSSLLFAPNSASTPPIISTGTSDSSTIKADATPPAFGINPSAFGQTTSETPSFFGSPATVTVTEASTFAQPASAPATSSFGQPVTSSSFPTVSTGFFSQALSFGANATTSSSEPSSQASAFSFGKSTFAQNSGSFGLAKSLFGQTTAPTTTQTNSASNFSFAQSPTNVFGQGTFFSGLGGKPSEENANKNVFAMTNTAKPSTETSPFGSSSAFGAKNNSFTGAGSFTSGGGSVAQSGFGAFQQSTPQKAAFGSPSFGGAPTFGSPPAFGAPPTFGSGNSLTASVFGQQQMPNFSNIANSSSPTFGTLASQNTGSFGNSPSAGFGSSGGFGNSSFGNSSFGGFGSPSSPPSNSAFTQWRN